MIEKTFEQNAIIIILMDNLKKYNKSPLYNRNNLKGKCDINELPEGRVFQ